MTRCLWISLCLLAACGGSSAASSEVSQKSPMPTTEPVLTASTEHGPTEPHEEPAPADQRATYVASPDPTPELSPTEHAPAGPLPQSVEFCGDTVSTSSTRVGCRRGPFQLDVLSRLPKLVEADFSQSVLRDVGPLATVQSLEVLYLEHTAVRNIKPLSNLKNLRELYLEASPVRDVSALASLANLEALDLRETPVRNIAPLSGLANLTFLSLTGTRVKDIGPLKALTKLKVLRVYDTEIPSTQLRALQDELPDLKIER